VLPQANSPCALVGTSRRAPTLERNYHFFSIASTFFSLACYWAGFFLFFLVNLEFLGFEKGEKRLLVMFLFLTHGYQSH